MSQPPENTPKTNPGAEHPSVPVTGPLDDGQYDFYIVVTPGFEILAEKEIIQWARSPAFSTLLESEIRREHGGLSVRLPLAMGCELNRVLKIPTRILIRLSAFGCRDFPKLFKKTAGFNWSDWIVPGVEVDFQASTHKSRLFIKKRIEETCREGFEKYRKASGLETQLSAAGRAVQQVLVRVNNDVCTISLDTSGELLHKRGLKRLSSEAPIRETIAATLLSWMMSDETPASITLVDPMIGSGTFAMEADHLGKISAARSFAFESFPIYASEVPPMISARPLATMFTKFVGLDLDAKAAKTTKQNWIESGGESQRLSIEVADVFDAKPLAIEGERWLITNPPYGERLKIEGRLKDYYELLFETCERIAQPDRACFVLPDTARPAQLRIPSRWKTAGALRFQNGGLPVTALLFVND